MSFVVACGGDGDGFCWLWLWWGFVADYVCSCDGFCTFFFFFGWW